MSLTWALSDVQEGNTALDHAESSLKENQDEYHAEKMNAVISILRAPLHPKIPM